MTDPKPRRLTSAELVRLADGTVAAVKKLALHLAAVEAEREARSVAACEHAPACPALGPKIGARCTCKRRIAELTEAIAQLGTENARLTLENAGMPPAQVRTYVTTGEAIGSFLWYAHRDEDDPEQAESSWRAERDHLRACLDRVEGALTDAKSVPVHSDALWISVQKLTEERDNWRGRAACAEDIAAERHASTRDQALEDAARIRALKGGAK